LAFTVDVVGYFNEFNLKLQGKTVLISETCSIVKSYHRKFELFETQITLNKFDHFPCSKKISNISKIPIPKQFATDVFSELKSTVTTTFFGSRCKSKRHFHISNPFDCTIEELPSDFQLEVVDLQNDDKLKMMFKEMDLTQFYKYLPEDKYCQLKSYARGFISVFGRTYQCERTFSKMKYVKSQYRSLLTDDHLRTTLMIGNTNFELQYDEILSQKIILFVFFVSKIRINIC
jgi:hypothetical protein